MTSTRSETGFVRDRALVIGAALGTFAAARAFAPYVQHGPVLCAFRGLTGLPCPGCGLTRAFCALASGDVLGALAFHACALPLALGLGAAALIALGELGRGEAWTFYRRGVYSSRLAYWGFGSLALYHAGRCAYWAHAGTLFEKPAWIGAVFTLNTIWPSAAG